MSEDPKSNETKQANFNEAVTWILIGLIALTLFATYTDFQQNKTLQGFTPVCQKFDDSAVDYLHFANCTRFTETVAYCQYINGTQIQVPCKSMSLVKTLIK